MWIVVHFLQDDSVESVPNIWYNKKEKKCAWPLSKHSVKKFIEKRGYPNELEFQWLPARVLGHNYESLYEARAKANKAQFLTDLSSNEDDNKKIKSIRKNKISPKCIPNPPTLIIRKKKTLEKLVDFNNHVEFDIEDNDDTDKDPDYQLPAVNVDMTPVKSQDTSFNCYLNSPIGKIVVENISPSFDHGTHEQSMCGSSSQPIFSTPVKATNKKRALSRSPDLRSSSSQLIFSSPVVAVNTNKQSLCMPEPSQKFILGPRASTSASNNIGKKKENGYLMPSADLQNFIINTLTKVKFDIAQLISTTTATNLILENMQNGGHLQTTNLAQSIEEPFSFRDIFPISSDVELNEFENKLEADKQFRSNIISKLSLLVGNKSVGDSVHRLESKMFDDEVLVAYSLQGFKKKKSFQKLAAYNLLIDALRVHPRFRNPINKEFDVPLAVWLAHAKTRLHSKIVDKTK